MSTSADHSAGGGSGDAGPLRIEVRHYGDPAVQELVADVQAEYVRRYGGPDEAVVRPEDFDPPHGLFLVVFLEGAPVAMGGWRLMVHPDGADGQRRAEIKRMYVVAAARRRGLACMVLRELERRAYAAGVGELWLNTGGRQPEAVALYESAGYEPVAGFGRYADAPDALFYGKVLRAPGGPGTGISPG